MAAVYVGAFEQSCAKCRRSPALREAWGCDAPAQAAVQVMEDDEGNEVEFMSCPLKFIPRCVNEFMEKRMYLEKYPHTAPAFDVEDSRYLAFDRYFTGKVNEFRSLMSHTGELR